MNLSKKWLNDYFTAHMSDKEFSDIMTMSGSKVEGIKQEGEELSNIVVGKVLQIDAHPNSDHLWICQLDAGQPETIQIVTGAQNLTAGDFVPVALDNSVIFGGKIIKKGKLRDEDSEGMLCSLNELGLSTHDFPYAAENGIFVLGDDCDKTIGTDIRAAIGFNDTVTEFEITSNRPDCLCVIGLAREAAAACGKTLQTPNPVFTGSTGNAKEYLKVVISDPKKCYRYIGAVVTDVKIEPSPRWLRERLRASGVRPINNIVDITNYVMLEYGQPMHAFDIRYLDNSEVNVRCAKIGEKIITLDGFERLLDEDMLVIADANKPVAIAGVMGGEHSGIMDETNTIIFESACFNGSSVRNTAKKLGMRTESSARFEKELDPNNCLPSINRALQLVEELNAGSVVNGLVDCNCTQRSPVVMPFNWKWVNSFVGIDVSAQQQKEFLERIGFTVDNDLITVPTFRNDVEHLADISEEIARFYGYENIPNCPITGIANGKLSDRQQFEKLMNEVLLACGLSEIQTYSFTGAKCFDKICLSAESETRKCICISNPMGEDTGIMRTTCLPSMLEVIARNYKYRNPEAMFYEIATEYISRGNEELPVERQKIVVGMYGGDSSYTLIKGIVEEVLNVAGIDSFSIEVCNDNPGYHPGRCAIINIDNDVVAVLGEIHPQVQLNYDVNTKIFMVEIDFELLLKYKNLKRTYKPLPKYPAIDRDLSFSCAKNISVLSLQNVIANAAGPLLESISLFDIYEGSQIAKGTKSLAFTIRLRSSERTLTDKDADEAMRNVVNALNNMGITLRT